MTCATITTLKMFLLLLLLLPRLLLCYYETLMLTHVISINYYDFVRETTSRIF